MVVSGWSPKTSANGKKDIREQFGRYPNYLLMDIGRAEEPFG
jgi:hypothetical protein